MGQDGTSRPWVARRSRSGLGTVQHGCAMRRVSPDPPPLSPSRKRKGEYLLNEYPGWRIARRLAFLTRGYHLLTPLGSPIVPRRRGFLICCIAEFYSAHRRKSARTRRSDG